MQMITTSEIKISALVVREQSLAALRTVHREFELAAIDGVFVDSPSLPVRSESSISVLDVVKRLQEVGMESLMIDDVALDDSQARVTLCEVPNKPGIAADLFERIAAAGIFVDMIVQSYAAEDFADITFTVPRTEFKKANFVAKDICQDFGCSRVASKESIAKLTVSGIGLRSHTGVAIGMFKALSEARINVEMMNTSEIRVNIVVDGRDGQAGIACLKKEFASAK